MRIHKSGIKLIAFLAFLSFFGSCKTDSKNSLVAPMHEYGEKLSYQNPVVKGFFPDPSICRAGNDYYLVNSSFEFFPGVPVLHSGDLVNWEHIANAITRKSQLVLGDNRVSEGIWAPVIRYFGGKFYLVITDMFDGTNMLLTADDPSGPWSDPLVIPQKNIDPSLFMDDDGKVYYTGTSPWSDNAEKGIYQAEIDLNTGKLLTDYRLVWKGCGGRYPEGPHLYKRNKWYYLMISEGGTETGHTVNIARSRKPEGPYEECPYNPILTNRDQPYENPVQNSGHADLIQAPDGKWWMVHLAVRNVNKHHHLGRETFLLPVDWTREGWPVVNSNGVSQTDIYASAPGIQKNDEVYGKYNFDEKQGPEWNYLRNPVLSDYNWDVEKGFLELKASEINLDSNSNPSFLGIRQKDFTIEVESCMEFYPREDGEEAGIVAYMSGQHYYSVCLHREDSRNFVQCIMKLGNVKHIAAKQEIQDGKLFLRINADPHNYRFYYSPDGKNWNLMGENMTRFLSSETAGTFTGTYLGMYATGNGRNTQSVAKFDYFWYKSLSKD